MPYAPLAPSSSAPAPRISRLEQALAVPVFILAAFSLVTWGFPRWIDLRSGGAPLAFVLPLLWAISVLAFWAIRRDAGGRAAYWRRTLLWPTIAVLACLIINTFYYFYLMFFRDQIDTGPVPITLFIGLLLWAWLFSISRSSRIARSHWHALPHRSGSGPLTALVYVLTLLAFATWFFLFQFRQSPPPPGVVCDLAVVLGTRVMPNGTASDALRNRALAAVDLYRAGRVRYIMVSGSIDPITKTVEQSEAMAMRQVCLDAGVPDRVIAVDPVGVNTRATVANTIHLMKRFGLHSIVSVSDDYHLPRIRQAFRAAGIETYTVASQPSHWVLAEPRAILHEMVGIPVYWLFPGYRQARVSAMNVKSPRIIVQKAAGTLQLLDGGHLLKTYRCITGTNEGNKEVEGDRKTPIGRFHICYKNPESKFHLSLGLDYPNADDARRGLRERKITLEQYNQIIEAIRTTGIPNWYTPLGGEIFIHGHGEGRANTAGCIAVSNPDVEELYAICDVGTPVEILP